MSQTLKRLLGVIAVATVFGCASGPHTESAGEFVDDSALTAKVKTAIFNDPSLKIGDISVESFKGEVQLRGFVDSQATADRAVATTRGVPGVRAVLNDLRIR